MVYYIPLIYTQNNVHVVHVATMYVYNAVPGKYMYYGIYMGHACISIVMTTDVLD